MNLIEKVARALCIDFGYSPNAIDRDRKGVVLNPDRKAWMLWRKQAQAAISAMPSIKWQKIETLPELHRASSKTILFYTDKLHIGYWSNSYQMFYANTVDVLYPVEAVSHWAEINAPEDE